MAIIQISKIQQRSGNLVDLPQLDEAQFGWASDARRLFIGKTTPNENIEVLTSYSNISFSQIDGSDGGNFNIANATNGQVLTYVDTTNTWENWPSTAILTANANFKLDLGDVGNIKMDGGATGYILETDGVGNVAWTSKGTLRTVITALSNATPVIMTVANTTPYTNGLAVTISGANAANANTIVNGQTFYVKVAVDFPTSGNAELYTTQDLANANAVVGTTLGTYTANSGVATALISGSGVSNAGGSVNTIQFNNLGTLNGSANFTITGGNLVTLNGNFNASNIAGGNLVTANFVTGTLTANSAAQPNITSTGTLAGLIVAGNITPSANITYNLGNNTNRFNDLYLSNSTIYIGAQTISANTSSVIVSGNLVANMIGNVSGNATTAGTVITAAQPNITSTGTLVSLSVSGNANIGNIGTAGLITATGNITGANIITGGLITATGNITGANIITGGLITATGNITGANINTSGLITATGNITGANIITSGLITAIGNLNAGNIITAGVVSATGNGTFGNVSATGVFVSTLSATANANVGNLGTAGLIVATGNVTGGNLTTSGVVTAIGNVTAGNLYANSGTLGVSTANIVTLNVTGLSNLNAVGNVRIFGGNANQILQTDGAGNLSWTDPNGGYYLHTQVSANTVWTVTHNLNRQYVTVEAIDDNGNSYTGRYDYPTISYTNANALTMTFTSAVPGYAAVTGGGININTSNVGNSVPGGVNTQVQFNDAGVLGGSSGLVYDKTTGTLTTTLYAGSGANLTNIAGANVTGQVSFAATANAVAGANVSGAVSFATTANAVAGANVSGAVANATNATTAGTVTTAAQPNITSVGTLSSLAVTGNISGGNFVGTGVGSPAISSSGSLSISATSGVTLNNVVTLSTGGNTTAGNITGNWTLTSGSRLQSTYADLAEYYEADSKYEPGTVLAFGGDKEVTIAEDGTTRVAGVVSTNPAYAMNATCKGIAVAIALQGRVPTKVRGSVRKGDMMVSAGNGFARPWNNPAMGTVIGKALENFDGVEGIIEIAVGRL
jgi:hypothetical protein